MVLSRSIPWLDLDGPDRRAPFSSRPGAFELLTTSPTLVGECAGFELIVMVASPDNTGIIDLPRVRIST